MFKVTAKGAGLGLAAVLLAGTAVATDMAAVRPAHSAATPKSEVVAVRRITESQYRHALSDVFGPGLEIKGRFEPEKRVHNLLAVGASEVSVSSLGFQQYFAMGRAVADQLLDEGPRRDQVMPCKPADASKADDKCTEAFLRKYGTMLFRRPITNQEVAARVALARTGAEGGGYYEGLKLALVSMLSSPEFLFRYETAIEKNGELELDGYTRAARLSYLYWDTTPDAELLRAAEKGELQTKRGLERQVARLESSPRMEDGLRALFSDILQFERLDERPKNPDIYPKYSQAVVESAREQTLRTVVDLLLTNNGDYRDLLTTRKTFIDKTIAAVYKVPFTFKSDWIPYTFTDESGRAGIQSQVLFLSEFSHPGRSSPTLRGVGLNEVFLCKETPLPPANVDFSIVNDTANPLLKTVRARLLAHATDETCASCHNTTDPIGLSLEHFDGLGQPRLYENGVLIDVTANLDGAKFNGAPGLAEVMRDNPKIPECAVKTVFQYGAGRELSADEQYGGYLKDEIKAFSDDGYHWRGLVRRIAMSDAFYNVVISDDNMQDKPETVAQNQTGQRTRSGATGGS